MQARSRRTAVRDRRGGRRLLAACHSSSGTRAASDGRPGRALRARGGRAAELPRRAVPLRRVRARREIVNRGSRGSTNDDRVEHELHQRRDLGELNGFSRIALATFAVDDRARRRATTGSRVGVDRSGDSSRRRDRLHDRHELRLRARPRRRRSDGGAHPVPRRLPRRSPRGPHDAAGRRGRPRARHRPRRRAPVRRRPHEPREGHERARDRARARDMQSVAKGAASGAIGSLYGKAYTRRRRSSMARSRRTARTIVVHRAVHDEQT